MSCSSSPSSLHELSPGRYSFARPQTAPSAVGALLALTKPQLACFSVLTTMAAFATAARHASLESVSATLFGTTLAAGGALSLNQWWERRTDALMRRTQSRPIPRAAVTPATALTWSLLLSLSGVSFLATQVNGAAAAFAAATILIYGAIYTPLKRRTRWATEIGSISGALPPLIGNAAAENLGAMGGWLIAALLLCWQMPHFFAIGWNYRVDYRAAGFPLLPAVDPTGGRTAAWSLGYTVLLFLVSMLPTVLGLTGLFYAIVAAIAGIAFLRKAWRFLSLHHARDQAAQRLFVASIVYLPLMLIAVVIDAW